MSESNLTQSIREAHRLAGNLAEELVRLENEQTNDYWSGHAFFDVMAGFLTSFKAIGFEIESASLGGYLREAIQNNAEAVKSRFRFEITSNLKTLTGGKRSGYMFFVFWPKLHSALVNQEQ